MPGEIENKEPVAELEANQDAGNNPENQEHKEPENINTDSKEIADPGTTDHVPENKEPEVNLEEDFLSADQIDFINNLANPFEEKKESEGNSDILSQLEELKEQISKSKSEEDYNEYDENSTEAKLQERLDKLEQTLAEQKEEKAERARQEEEDRIEGYNRGILKNFSEKKLQTYFKLSGINDLPPNLQRSAKLGINSELTAALSDFEDKAGRLITPKETLQITNSYWKYLVQGLDTKDPGAETSVSAANNSNPSHNVNVDVKVKQLNERKQQVAARISEIQEMPVHERARHRDEINKLSRTIDEIQKEEKSLQS